MKKIRLYLDTSIISHLNATDTPEKMLETLALWEDIKIGKYEIILSDLVFNEIKKCGQPKRDEMILYLEEIEYTRTNSEDEHETIGIKS